MIWHQLDTHKCATGFHSYIQMIMHAPRRLSHQVQEAFCLAEKKIVTFMQKYT